MDVISVVFEEFLCHDEAPDLVHAKSSIGGQNYRE